MRGVTSTFKVLTGKPTAKRSLGRPRRRWENIEWILNIWVSTGGIRLI